MFARRFIAGEPADADSQVLRALIAPHLGTEEPESRFAELIFEDGTADLYSDDEPGTGFMVSHVSGRRAWDLIARVAAAGEMALIAPGMPTLIFSEAARAQLPAELADDAVVVTSGADILRAIADG